MSDKLNPEQEKAAHFGDGICAVIAVPGSGKTRTMMERIGILVKKHGIPPESILGLTFTRNAADEMRNRLVPVLGDLAARVHLSTIHSFCHTVLRSEGRVFDIISGRDQIVFVRKIMDKLKAKSLSPGMVIREISLAKNNLIFVEEFRDLYQGDKSMQKVAEVYEEYERLKEKRLLMDFDDLLVETFRILDRDEHVRDKYGQVFKHLLCDEFQDTNPAILEVLKLLIGTQGEKGKSFWCAADDAQSIYGFTGASVGNVINFQEMFPGSSQLFLTLNYRSTPQILAACHNLIQHNERQIRKELRTENPAGEDIVVLESSSEETEALNLVNEVKDLIEGERFAPKDIAVLYRCNFQSRLVEEAFLQHKIPYCIQNGLTFYDRPEVKGLLDYMRLIHDPASEQGDEALLSIINKPNRYIGRAFIMPLREFGFSKRLRLYPALKEMKVEIPYLRKNVRDFVGLVDAFIGEARDMGPAELIANLRTALDWERFVTDDDIPTVDDPKVANIDQLQLAAGRYKDLGAFLEYTRSFQEEGVSDNKEGVHLMTVHKAKGLEFKVVCVIGMVEGIMPSRKDSNIEEERRIAFVAMSRAMNLLYLSHTLTYLGQPAKKSIFLDEIRGAEPARNAA